MRASLGHVSLLSLALTGCYASHVRSADAGPTSDAATCDPALRPRCARRASPCDTLALVDPICFATSWQCPEGAAPYAPPWTDDRCLPLRDLALFADGVHESPVPVPIGDHCEWIFPFQDGARVQLMGVAS